MKELKIGTSWVRGIVGDALTPELAVDFACGFGTWSDGEPVVVGRDTRRSSPMLRSAVMAGLLSSGCEVIDLGVATTPLVSFAVRELGAAGGISITGSHNDSQWNALKFVGPDGALLDAAAGEELLDFYHAKTFRTATGGQVTRIEGSTAILDRYLQHLLSALSCDAVRERRFQICVDFCNGAAVSVTRRFLEALGCRLHPLNANPTGDLAHSPAPSPATMGRLSARTRTESADLGAALNIDGDRIGFVTADGQPLSEEYALPLAAQNRLKRRPGAIVANLSTSRMIDHLASRHSQTVARTSVGESFVVHRGLEIEAALAGEGSGGVAALPFTTTFDGLLTLGLVLETMATDEKTLAQLVGELPKLHVKKGEIRCSPARAYRAVDAFRSAYADEDADLTDGVRIDRDDAWLHVRVSSTEPLLRLIVEADHPERAASLFDEAQQIAADAVGEGGK